MVHVAVPEVRRLGWRTLVAVLLFYVVCLAGVTYPVVCTFSTRLPGTIADPLQALRVLRWYKECLLAGRSPFHCPDIQYPIGAPLGNFSPLHFQALLYLPLSLLTGNDILCYNLMWFINLLFTGLGAFLLIWHVLRDRACACFGGLQVMLSTPVLLHAHGHLELITLGWLPLFLVAWMRWVDRPTSRRLLGVAGLYLLVALSAAYFAVFAIVPAVWYLVRQFTRQGPVGALPWLRSRLGWLGAFASLTVPCLLVLFSGQLWSRVGGYSLPRTRNEFAVYGVPPWACLMPSRYHLLQQLLPFNPYQDAHLNAVECCSYLGLVTLVLLGYALVTRAALPRRRYWWSLLLIFLVLSFGAFWKIGPVRISLPAEWLYKTAFIFQLIRSPARFNLCVVLCAGLLAAAGLRHLLTRLPSAATRGTIWVGLWVLALLDLQMVPFRTRDVPPAPPCYAILCAQHPQATFLEVPQLSSGGCNNLNSACAYWQVEHHGKTSAGYSGFTNVVYDHLVFEPSPFAWPRLMSGSMARTPERMSCDLVTDVRLDDYIWLYLTAHHFDYLVMHQGPDLELLRDTANLDWLKARLEAAKIFEDDRTAVYEKRRLAAPQRPVLLCTTGWRTRRAYEGRQLGNLTRTGHLALYNPQAEQALTFTLEGVAFQQPRRLRLRAGDTVLACWKVMPDALNTYTSLPVRLPGGLQDLILESDGDKCPSTLESADDGDATPISLRIATISVATGSSESIPDASIP
jgi:hypothetical protein